MFNGLVDTPSANTIHLQCVYLGNDQKKKVMTPGKIRSKKSHDPG